MGDGISSARVFRDVDGRHVEGLVFIKRVVVIVEGKLALRSILGLVIDASFILVDDLKGRWKRKGKRAKEDIPQPAQ